MFNLSDHLGTSAVPGSNTVVDPTTASIFNARYGSETAREQVSSTMLTHSFFLTSIKSFTGGSGHKSVHHDVCLLRSIGAFIVYNPIILGSCRQLASILEVLFERFGIEPSGLCRTSIWWGYLVFFFTSPLRKAVAVECTVPD